MPDRALPRTTARTDIARITGVGETAYTRAPSARSSLALQLEAALAAVRDAGLQPGDIDGIVPSSVGSATAEDFIENFGITDLRFSATVPMGGASAVAGLQLASAVIGAGICRHVLLVVGRDGRSGNIGARLRATPQFRTVAEFETPSGAFAPVELYAPMARRHMATYGTRSEDFAHIAVTMRQHAIGHPNALMKKPITIADHQASRMIAEPFRLLDCSLESSGAAAVVVSARECAADLRQHPVHLLATAEGHPDSPSAITQRRDLLTLGIANQGVGPDSLERGLMSELQPAPTAGKGHCDGVTAAMDGRRVTQVARNGIPRPIFPTVDERLSVDRVWCLRAALHSACAK